MTALEKKFYHLFWNDELCQSIFLKHKTELLENEVELILSKEKAYPPRLVLTNSLKQKQYEETALQRTEFQGIEVLHNLQNYIKRFIDEDRIKAYSARKFGKIITKFKKEVIDTNSLIGVGVELLDALRSEKETMKLLDRFGAVPKGIKTLAELKSHYEKEITTDIKKFLSNENLIELVLTIDHISAYHNQKLKENLIAATKHSTDLFYNNENYKSRISLFDKLFDHNIILGKDFKSYYECVSCPPDTFNGIITTNIRPSKLSIKCPNCSKETYYIVPYKIHDTIYKQIIHADGLLFFAIQHILEDKKFKFKVDQTFLKDVQIDILLYDDDNLISEAIEVKMFKTDRPKDTQIGNLRQSVGQVIKIKEKMNSSNTGDWINLPYAVVTNITDENIIRAATNELNTDLNRFNIAILTPNQLLDSLFNAD